MLNQEILKSIAQGEWSKSIQMEIRKQLTENPKTIVVLDDDPTGTQTVYGVPVITEWTEKILEKEFLTSPLFFILTNSRSLQVEQANDLGRLLGERLDKIAKKHKKEITLISRGDSTLRGHYPNEVDALAEGLGLEKAKHIIAPAFFEGGRYTYNDIHYVKEGAEFIPAAETPFAQDNTFGYISSNLKNWVVEKSKGNIKSSEIVSFSIHNLRNKPIEDIVVVVEKMNVTRMVANAVSYLDLQKLALACVTAKTSPIFRTAASFINAISGIEPKACLTKNEILGKHQSGGALVVVGSYVPKTTHQLNYLKEHSDAIFLELDVSNVLETSVFEKEIMALTQKIDTYIKESKDVVLYTSRTIVKGATKEESLKIVNLVSNGLITIVKELNNQPKYIVAKGGITSSDVATKALTVKRANVLGQVLKGVPVWQLGEEAKFPSVPYIIFPGNVGDVTALYKLTKLLK